MLEYIYRLHNFVVQVFKLELMTVSSLFSGKGIGQLAPYFMTCLNILKAFIAMPTKAIKLVLNSSCCNNDCDLEVYITRGLASQSGIETAAVDTSNSIQEQNVGFVDNEVDVVSAIPHIMSYTKVDTSQNVELGSFLQRPVQIFAQSWQIGTNLTAATSTFDPWYEYFNNAVISKKLDNYYLLRCNLHLKFVINASPFYYGCCIAAYQPLSSYSPSAIISNSDRDENVPFSQRPHIYLYPQNSQGGEMVLPFLFQKNWLDATDLGDLIDMGTIDLQSFTTLANANGLTTDTIQIKVYAWAEDLELAGPTVKLSLQAGKDEYSHTGTISKPASAIARAAGQLSSLPIIGPFATATSYAAGAVGDIAALFGYTDVPVIDDVHAFKPKSYPNFAATDIGTPLEKLTLDAKNELSIDAKISGANVDDELLLKSFCGRESFIFKSAWAASDAADTSLFYARVSPVMSVLDGTTVTNATLLYATPMAHVARCFKYWRGDIIFKLKFICSAYHRGRVRINWDPIGDIGTSGDYTTQTYTRIVDITEETEVEIVIPYTQATAYLTTPTSGEYFASSSTSTSQLGTRFNGIFTVRVLNEQTSPVASADIQMLVFVKGADNLEFAAPVDISSLYSPYAPQSGMQFDVDTSVHEMGLSSSQPDPNINLVYMGEHCVSIRQLLRRCSAYKRASTDTNTSVNYFVGMKTVLARNPQYPGFDTNGYDTAIGLTSAVSEAYNWTCWSYTTWFSSCFVGSRGSYHYTINPSNQTDINSLAVSRADEARTTYVSVSLDLPITNQTDFVRRFCDTTTQSIGMAGMSLASQKTLAGVAVSVPMYNKVKFMSNDPLNRTDGESIDNSNVDTFVINSISYSNTDLNASNIYQDLYISAGTDFSLIFFLNIPTLYLYDSLPTAV